MRLALLDVGGTLWPDRAASLSEPGRLAALARLVPASKVMALLEHLDRAAASLEGRTEQDTIALVRSALDAFALGTDPPDPERVRAAMVVPARIAFPFFPGATDLLCDLHAEGFRTVLVTNTAWRRAEDHVRDLADAGLDGYVDGVVSSVDVGKRKPDHALIQRVLAVAGARPDQAIAIGDREDLDILPALSLGIATIQVCIEDAPPPRPRARWVASSHSEVMDACRAWTRER